VKVIYNGIIFRKVKNFSGRIHKSKNLGHDTSLCDDITLNATTSKHYVGAHVFTGPSSRSTGLLWRKIRNWVRTAIVYYHCMLATPPSHLSWPVLGEKLGCSLTSFGQVLLKFKYTVTKCLIWNDLERSTRFTISNISTAPTETCGTTCFVPCLSKVYHGLQCMLNTHHYMTWWL